MAQEKVKFPVYSFQNECCIVFIALIVFIASVTGTGDDELPLSDALIASLILLLGITFCLFYKLGFSRIDSTDMIQIGRELTPVIKFSTRIVNIKDISIKKHTERHSERDEIGRNQETTISYRFIQVNEETILKYRMKDLYLLFGGGPIKKLERMIPEITSRKYTEEIFDEDLRIFSLLLDGNIEKKIKVRSAKELLENISNFDNDSILVYLEDAKDKGRQIEFCSKADEDIALVKEILGDEIIRKEIINIENFNLFMEMITEALRNCETSGEEWWNN
jgi:hypothetical protein